MCSLESDECSLSSGPVRLGDETIRLEDCVDASMADLDALSLQVGFDGFAAPAFTPPNLYDPGHGFLWQAMNSVRSPRRIYQPHPSVPLEPKPPVINRTFGHHDVS